MTTTPDLLRRAADLLDRRPDLSAIDVNVYNERATIQVLSMPAYARLTTVERGEAGWYHYADLDGFRLVCFERAS
jgi:hypothetical protein